MSEIKDRTGCLLKIKPEYLDEGEDPDTLYYCIEDNGDRLLVGLAESDLPLPSTHVWADYMFDVVKESLQEDTPYEPYKRLKEMQDLWALLLYFSDTLKTDTSVEALKFKDLATINHIDFQSLVKITIEWLGDTDIGISVIDKNGLHDLLPFISALDKEKLATNLVNAYSLAIDACKKQRTKGKILRASVYPGGKPYKRPKRPKTNKPNYGSKALDYGDSLIADYDDEAAIADTSDEE